MDEMNHRHRAMHIADKIGLALALLKLSMTLGIAGMEACAVKKLRLLPPHGASRV